MLLTALLTTADCRNEPADVPQATSVESSLSAEAPRLQRLVHRLLGWPARGHDVDDVVQEVLLAAWRHRATFRGDASLRTWLLRIAIRKTQNHARGAAVRRRLFGWWSPQPLDPVAPESFVDQAGIPLDATKLDATQRAMLRLAHADREVLVLRYLEQREIPQIAELLGCSRAAVDARLSRARQRLRDELGLESP